MTEQTREQQLHQIISALFEIAAPGYLKTSLWKAYLVILSESGQKATRVEMNKGVLEPIAPQIQQILMDIARAYQADRKEAKGYENTESAICEALLPLAVPGTLKNSLWARYQELKQDEPPATYQRHYTLKEVIVLPGDEEPTDRPDAVELDDEEMARIEEYLRKSGYPPFEELLRINLGAQSVTTQEPQEPAM